MAKLGVVDYVVFALMLVVSASIGSFFAYKERKGNKTSEGYLLGGRQMSFITPAISLSFSLVSAVTVLGIPAEIYYYGSMYQWFFVMQLWILPLVTFVYIPFFYRLGITSTYEYLERRFGNHIRFIVLIVFLAKNFITMGITIYAPALALSAVTGFNLWGAIFSIGIVCSFYTAVGGFKAVIWTDVFQGALMIVGSLLFFFMSAEKAGGFSRIWDINYKEKRIEFDRIDVDPRVRLTVWSMVFGIGTLTTSVLAVDPGSTQRYLCCKSEKEAKRAKIFSTFVSQIILICVSLQAYVAFAYFVGCDPKTNNDIDAADQIIPYMIIEMFHDKPGLPGFYVAYVFAGCVSTVSSGINAISCVAVQDFIKPFTTWSARTANIVTKCLVFVVGAIYIGFALMANYLGGLIEASFSITGITGGPVLGVFNLGMMFESVNSWGAGSGLIAGMALTTWMFIGSREITSHEFFTLAKPLSVEDCPINNNTMSNQTTAATFTTLSGLNTTSTTVDWSDYTGLNGFYMVSFTWYGVIGHCTTVIVGVLISLITNRYIERKETVDPSLIWLDFSKQFWKDLRSCRWCSSKYKKKISPELEKSMSSISQKSNNKSNVIPLGSLNENGNDNYGIEMGVKL